MANFKSECMNCMKFKKSYCVGTSIREKGLICCQKVTNARKYRAIKNSKKG